jgi:hypothetical protein
MLYRGPQQHQSTYDRIADAAMRYSAVVNYAGAVEIPLRLCHPVSSSNSASTAASQPTASRLRRHNNSHRRRAHTPTCSGRLFPPVQVLSVDLFSTNARNCRVFVLYYILIVQGDRRSFRQPGLDSRRRHHLERRSFR